MDIDSILKKSSLSLYHDSKKILVKSEFRFLNKGNLGMIFIGLLSLALMIATIVKVEKMIIVIFAIIIGLFMFIFSILGILKQVTDFVEISDRKIKFSNSLKKYDFLFKPNFKIKVKSSIERVKRRGSPASYFCIVELILKTDNGKFRILDFQTDEKDAAEAKMLGKDIKRMIFERIGNF